MDVSLFHSQSYETVPPAFSIAATAALDLAQWTIHPSQPPITTTRTIIPRTLKRRNLRQGRDMALA